MIDLRYYVISLVAVFLALGIGILLGTTLVERGLISEQKAEIHSLRRTFDQIKEKNKALNDDLNYYKNYASQSTPYMITARLEGRAFAMVQQDGVEGNVAARVTDAVTTAGGQVSVIVTLVAPQQYDNPDFLGKLAAYYQVPPEPQAVRARVFSDLVGQLQTASNPAVLQQLADLGALRISASLTAPLSGAAIYAGDKMDQQVFEKNEIPLAQAFQAGGLLGIAVGGSTTDDAVLVRFKEVGMATVDHVDEVPGQVALVLSFGGQPGNYGRGKSASSVLPPASQ